MNRVSFYTLFRVDLIQMFRHGEIKQAIRRAGEEFRLAKKSISDAGGRESGVVMVPSPARAMQLGYSSTMEYSYERNGKSEWQGPNFG